MPLPEILDQTLDGPTGPIPIRLYRPARYAGLPALLYLHGGGFILGSNDTHDRIMRRLARDSGAAVVGIDYPLAPEHRFPAALDAVVAAIAAIAAASRQLGLDAGRLALGGDSAGAHLALAAALSRGGATPKLRGLLLYYGLYGRAGAYPRTDGSDPAFGPTAAELAFYQACYLGEAADPCDRRFDLLAADLGGLPPAFVAGAALDPLLADSRLLAARLEAAGNRLSFLVYERVPHGFLHWSRLVAVADRALSDGATWLGRQLQPAG